MHETLWLCPKLFFNASDNLLPKSGHSCQRGEIQECWTNSHVSKLAKHFVHSKSLLTIWTSEYAHEGQTCSLSSNITDAGKFF